MMANSARDPYWQAGVRRETIDHPQSKAAIEDECSKCHMPMARYQAKFEGREGEVFSHLTSAPTIAMDGYAQDGVSCSLCHQITKDKLGTRESLVGGFVVDTTRPLGEREEYGPFKIENGETRIMRTSSGGYSPTEGEHIRQSELCATCHTLITEALGPGGQEIGELPEQMPYQEWLAATSATSRAARTATCRWSRSRCAITSVLGKFREGMSRHTFVGGNFFMQRMLNKYRGDLGVIALPEEFESAANRTIEHLQTRDRADRDRAVDVAADRLEADVVGENLSGHKFPTAYPSRRAWLHVTVRDRNNAIVFESGALQSERLDSRQRQRRRPARFEPHYTEITAPIRCRSTRSSWSAPTTSPTTGLLTAVRFIKDNRLLPSGFDKRRADPGDRRAGRCGGRSGLHRRRRRVRYSVPLGNAPGPFQVEAELWFQPISYRWANNLKPYDAMEPQRFTGYYDTIVVGVPRVEVGRSTPRANSRASGPAACRPALRAPRSR